MAAAGDRRTPFYFRTEDGAEVDLILERGGEIELAIEIKRTTAPSPSRGFRIAIEALRPKRSYLLHPGTTTWKVSPAIEATTLPALMEQLIQP